ncbi:MAG: acetylornithine deacetylase [Gammaproteobacteria bacterium]|nr:acetylornithine deacetylase [Gammaproteobacteria bacterium]NIR83658.1 acetylornithine deacetylase [Gammaproteobacteria bacterium]NIR91633.1 acetylornithine deacetylase [Gammaproteobacteria bacterium]NIU04820.1 acetylornithine deacetylase [Gammaproteobacteria bacterium]NIV51806.1 acetylornithine deacetylase [Gammaproteobacteria bacterium]
MATPEPTTLPMISRLIGFDTTSRNSNLELIEFVRDYLADLGVDSHLVYDGAGRKANLFATLGPTDRPGICLSGHTDVVPVDDQDWHTDPFQAVRGDGRLYGRGTADMKSFLGVCLGLAPELLQRELATPIHFAFTYDEEVGCVGVRPLIDWLSRQRIRPRSCVVGEPTGMRPVRAHKGKQGVRCHVRGLACHSAVLDRGVNAVEAAAEVITYLKSMARRFRAQGPFDTGFEPSYTSVHTGTVQGGTALNIVPEHCVFEFEFRYLPSEDPEALIDEVRRYAEEQVLPEMREVCGDAGFTWQTLSEFAGLETDAHAEIVHLVGALTENAEAGKVSFGTEAGLYQRAGMPSVVCGPGSIEQAHKPDEFIELEQIARCETFVRRLGERLSAAQSIRR